MRASFPVQFDAVFLGKSRESGEFLADDRKVEYPDAYDLAFESSEGLTQTCRVSATYLDQASDFDVVKLPKLTALRVVGDVNVRDDGASFKPTTIRKVS